MIRLLISRGLLGLLTLWLVSVLIFVSTEILPGDVATAILGQQATPSALQAIREALDLDRPPVERYFAWLGDMLEGDFGTSLASRREIGPLVATRLSNTLFLAAFAAVMAVPLSLGLGILSAIRRNTPLNRALSIGTLATISVPEFFVGYVLILVFAVKLGWFPSLSTVSAAMPFDRKLYATALPAVTLTLVVVAHMMRMTRAALIGVLSSPFIEMAHLKGLTPRRIVLRHALPNALAPIINIVVLNLAYMVVGVIVVEVVFVYPGMGQMMVDAVTKRDVPMVQACALVFAATYVVLNLAADIISIVANPRLRRPR